MNNKIYPRTGLAKIALTGFQVFAERTEFPISKINLMFGPNSAGKSSIEDAFEIVGMLKQSAAMSGIKTKTETLYSKFEFTSNKSIVSRISKENDKFLLKLKSCWRKTGSPAKYVQIMGIEIESALEAEIGDGLFIDSEVSSIQCKSINESFGFYLRSDDYDERIDSIDNIQFHYRLKIDNELLIYFSEGDLELGMNCKHSTIHTPDFSLFFDSKNIGLIAKEAKLKHPALANSDFVTLENNIIKFTCISGFNLSGMRAVGSDEVGQLSSMATNFLEYKNEYNEAFSIFSNAYEKILSSVDQGHVTIPVSATVSASRQIPSKNDLFIFTKTIPATWGSPLPVFLVDSQLSSFSLSADKHTGENIFSKNDYIYHLQDEEYFARVNYYLSTHLFVEKGYRLGYNSEYIEKDFEYFIEKSEPVERERLRLTFKQFYLADPDGTQFDFDEVGSGLGYILPVLCVLAQNQRQLVSVQQPELHLHPALQASLADVFIESADSKTLMVETHSEHLLLRILKRIRQTHLQAAIAPELKINADDVCVLYFDPSPDGTTTVKRLRITEDGEFMDRWPRGFFGERDQELLDE